MWVGRAGDELAGAARRGLGPVGLRARARSIRRAAGAPRAASVELSVSATTRPPRPGEQDGVDYHFLTPRRVRGERERGEFLEWAEVQRPLLRDARRARSSTPWPQGDRVLLEIDVQGALQVREQVARARCFVFIQDPEFPRSSKQRLRRRGTEDEATIQRRLCKAREELAEAHWYDVQVINDDLDRAVEEFVSALRSNRLWRMIRRCSMN